MTFSFMILVVIFFLNCLFLFLIDVNLAYAYAKYLIIYNVAWTRVRRISPC